MDNKYQGEKELRALSFVLDYRSGLSLKRTLTLPATKVPWQYMAVHGSHRPLALVADCDLFGPSIEGFPVEQNEDTLIVRCGNPK